MLRVIFIISIICILGEINRAPFDFVEGESELVSGFNIEYGRTLFTILFIAEYGIIIFFSMFISIFIFRNSINFFFICLIISIIIIIRSCYPRYRYDKFMFFT